MLVFDLYRFLATLSKSKVLIPLFFSIFSTEDFPVPIFPVIPNDFISI